MTPKRTSQASRAAVIRQAITGVGMIESVKNPNHVETVATQVDVDGEQHLFKFSRHHDNQQFWTVMDEHDEPVQGRKTFTATEPDEYELCDPTLDPFEQPNLAHPSSADDHTRALQQTLLELLAE